MTAPATIASALARAGIHDLPAPARAYLAGRFLRHGCEGATLGGLRDQTFGSAKRAELAGVELGLATFPDLDAGARAFVATAYRAAPRAWGEISGAELERLGRYPIDRAKPKVEGAPLGWWPGFGPSDEAQATFRALVADWEAIERAGVGEKVLPHLRQDVIDWRKFRDQWKAGDIDSSDIGGRLIAETTRARRIRQELKDAKILDPALAHDVVAPGVDASTAALKAASPVETWARGVPVLNWVTDPKLAPAEAKKRALIAVGGAAAALLVVAGLVRGRSPIVYVTPKAG